MIQTGDVISFIKNLELDCDAAENECDRLGRIIDGQEQSIANLLYALQYAVNGIEKQQPGIDIEYLKKIIRTESGGDEVFYPDTFPKTCYSKHLPRIKALLATDLTENYRVQLAAVLSAIETNQKLSGLEQLEDFLDMLEQK